MSSWSGAIGSSAVVYDECLNVKALFFLAMEDSITSLTLVPE